MGFGREGACGGRLCERTMNINTSGQFLVLLKTKPHWKQSIRTEIFIVWEPRSENILKCFMIYSQSQNLVEENRKLPLRILAKMHQDDQNRSAAKVIITHILTNLGSLKLKTFSPSKKCKAFSFIYVLVMSSKSSRLESLLIN